MIGSIEFEQPFFDDMEPEPKFSDELLYLILESVSETNKLLNKYSDQDIYRGARRLIEQGFLRGTILNGRECSFSRLTYRGRVLKNHLQEQLIMKGINIS